MARERYLVGAGEDTIHAGVIELKSAKDKRKNWWDYHKGHVLLGAVLLAAAVSVIYSIVSKVKPDYSIGLLTSFQLPERIIAQMEEHIAQYGEDRNGDGRVVVDLCPYVFSPCMTLQDQQVIQASFTRFARDAAMDACMAYLHDSEAFLMMEENFEGFFQYNDGSPMEPGDRDYQEAMRPWRDFAGLADFDPSLEDLDGWSPEVVDELMGRLRLSVRTSEGTAFASDEKKMAYYEDTLSLVDRLEAGK